jgi:hypothetical protein
MFLCLNNHHARKLYGGVETYFHAFLISSLDGGELLASSSGRSTAHWCTLDMKWVGSTASLDAGDKRNSLFRLPGIEPPISRSPIP